MNTIPTYDDLRLLADSQGLSIAMAFRVEGDFTVQADAVFKEFSDTYQPLLADKPYTALLFTYKNWVMAAAMNALDPGSAVAGDPVKVSSISDRQVVHRRNRLKLSPDLWTEYISEIESLAVARAKELVEGILSGGNSDELIQLHNLDMAQLGIDYGLTEDEDHRDSDLFSRLYASAVEAAMPGAA